MLMGGELFQRLVIEELQKKITAVVYTIMVTITLILLFSQYEAGESGMTFMNYTATLSPPAPGSMRTSQGCNTSTKQLHSYK